MECFTFVWKIVNFSFCDTQKDQDLSSPLFEAGNLKWKLQLCPKVGWKSELLRLVLKFNGEPTDSQFDCELSFIASDGTVLRNHKVEGATISESLDCISADFIPRTAIFGSKKELFLPRDILTVRCRIWKNGMEDEQYLAKTIFHRKNFMWNIEEFETQEKVTKSFQLALRHFVISLSKSSYTQSGFANIEITKIKGEDIYAANCKICVLSEDGKERANLHDYDSLPNNLQNPWHFPIILKNEDITKGTLSLHWEFTVGISEVSHSKTNSVLGNTSAVPQTRNNYDNFNITSSSTLQKDMLSLYKSQKLSDATLRSGDMSFHVHKSVLSARSSVLCAIFENETADYQAVDIPEVGQDTLEQMILFLYTDSIENIHWEDGLKLYCVANKYAIHPLKEKCIFVLKAELSVTNVCQIVSLAYTYNENDLMQYVQQFICEHDEIMCTQEWSCLEENSPQLTIKLLRAIAMSLKKRNI